MPFYEYTCNNRCKVQNLSDAYDSLLQEYNNGNEDVIEKLQELHNLKISFGYGYDEEYENKLRMAADDTSKSDHILVWEKLVWIGGDEVSELCPVCQSESTQLIARDVSGYIKGDGYLDKAGARRDMNKYTLEHNDPYAHMRPPGDKEHVMDKLTKAGKHGYDEHGNSKTQYFGPK